MLGRGALLLALLAPGAAFAHPPYRPASLVTGHWLDESKVVGVPCQRGDICLNVIGDVRFGRVRTLAGPDVGSSFTIRREFHARYVPGIEFVYLVRPIPGSRLVEASQVRHVWGGATLCVDRNELAENGVAVPPGATVGKVRVCFPPPPKDFSVKPEDYPEDKDELALHL